MPISTYKLYQCPKCKAKKSIYQGDCITSFPMCKNCQCMMDLVGDDEGKSVGGVLDMLRNWSRSK